MSLQELVKNSPCAVATVARLASVWGRPLKVEAIPDGNVEPRGRVVAVWDAAASPAAFNGWRFRRVIVGGDGIVIDWNA